MCGIIGCISDRKVSDVLLQGLSRLEYRGYDSAGIVIYENSGKLITRKQLGRIERLKALILTEPVEGSVGIGHTRWATHGEPTDFNAHPHCNSDNTLAIVHNGIIENYETLKIELMENGHEFVSDTDSEVIAHWIEYTMHKNNINFPDAILKSVQDFRGTFALGLIHVDYPGKLFAIRRDSPLIIGLGENENFIASDVSAILEYTKNVIYLEDNLLAEITKEQCLICDENKNLKQNKIEKVEWEIEKAEKGGYENFMLKEIHEQPHVLANLKQLLVNEKNQIHFPHIKADKNFLSKLNRIYIVSCGTAYYAGLTGRYIIEELTGIPVEMDLGSEFRYRHIAIEPNSWVIAISQSGETADTLASIRKAKEFPCRILSILNVVGSTIARESDDIIYIHAGPEIGVASTKAYTSQILTLYYLGLYLALEKNKINENQYLSRINELSDINHKVKMVLQTENQIKYLAKEYVQSKSAFYIGRGYNYPNALEGALKNKEISYMHAEGYAAGEMKHGPIALIDDNFLVICICSSGKNYEKMISNMKEVFSRKGRIISIVDEMTPEIKQMSEHVILVPKVEESMSPIINIVPLQLFAYYLALERGTDIDKPRNLAKSVTVE